MRYSKSVVPLLGVCVVAALVASCATGGGDSGMTRAEAKAQRDAFMKQYEYDDALDMWVPKPGTAAAQPVKATETRADAKKTRDAFLANNKYDDECACFKPVSGGMRDVSTLTKDERKAETKEFMRTHSFDEVTGQWVDRKPGPPQ